MKALQVCLLFLPVAAMSDTVLGYTLEYNGAFYAITVNDNGAVLKSGEETIYMGVNCDVLSTKGEQGFWSWYNGGFVITLPSRTMPFANADSPVENGGGCRS